MGFFYIPLEVIESVWPPRKVINDMKKHPNEWLCFGSGSVGWALVVASCGILSPLTFGDIDFSEHVFDVCVPLAMFVLMPGMMLYMLQCMVNSLLIHLRIIRDTSTTRTMKVAAAMSLIMLLLIIITPSSHHWAWMMWLGGTVVTFLQLVARRHVNML
jgi:hypothetical protein